MAQDLVGGLRILFHSYSVTLCYLVHLQYLDTKDLEAYLKALLDSRALLVQDGTYIKVFHQQHLAAASAKYVNLVIIYCYSLIAFSSDLDTGAECYVTCCRTRSLTQYLKLAYPS